MKKILLVCFTITLFSSQLLAQETHARTDENYYFDEGKTLYEQQQFDASTQSFKKFIQLHHNKKSGIYCEVEYYIAANAFMLQDDNALELLKNYLDKYPYAPMRQRVAYMIGRIYFEMGKYPEALKWYSDVTSNDLADSERNDYQFSKAYALLNEKDYFQASYIFNSLAGSDNGHKIDANYYYAYSQYCLQHFNTAMPIFKSLLDNHEYGEASAFHLQKIYFEQNDYDKVIVYGNKLIMQYPSSNYIPEAYRLIGESYYKQNNYAASITNFRRYENQAKNRIMREDSYMVGISYYQLNQYDNAINYLSRATVSNDSVSQNAYMYIGLSYLKLDDPSKASMAFQTASQMNFDKKLKEEATYNHALATYESDAPFGETIKAFDEFIKSYPNSIHLDDVYDHLSSVYMGEKDYHSALESIEKIHSVNPKIRAAKENALFQLGLSAYADNNFKQAIDYFTQSVKEHTANSFSAQAYVWRGDANYRLHNYDASINDLKSYLNQPKQQTNPVDILAAYYTLGYDYFEQKQYAQSQIWFSKYLSIQTDKNSNGYADVLNRLGDIAFNNRNFSDADKYYAQVQTNNPAYDYATFQRAFILGLQKKYEQKIAVLSKFVNDKNNANSDYMDDAMYEIGRSYVMLNQNQQAIDSYKQLIAKKPNSKNAITAALEIGMLYTNMNDYNNAEEAYKQVIKKYPNSEQARIAMESLQTLYVDQNKVDDYVTYRNSVAGKTITAIAKNTQDSLSFTACEHLFAKANYSDAITSLTKYLNTYCTGNKTINCVTAQYYLAESYYNLDDKQQALNAYAALIQMQGNSYMEQALLRASGLAYDLKDYTSAEAYFEKLAAVASTNENKKIANLGILRCSYNALLYDKTIAVASQIINASTNDTEEREARYLRAKAYIAEGKENSALPDLRILSKNLKSEMGAESKYLYAQILYNDNKYDQAKDVIMNFINQSTPHQYWLARAFVLLSDIYIKKNDTFQAKQYLLSLQENYKTKDDIQEMIIDRLDTIEKIEK